MVMPGVRFTLIESRRKRVSFLRHVAATLALGNVTVAHGRAESLDLPQYQTVLARAVAPPAELLALAQPLLAPGGRLVLLTSKERRQALISLATGFEPVTMPPPVAALKHRILVLQQ
jgi:16S rRNA (guanine527-N7)-methyltransferase